MILLALLVVAFLEYAVHRWVLHDKRTPVGQDHIEHHKVFTKTFVGYEKLTWFDKSWVRMTVMFCAYSFCCLALPLNYAIAIVIVGTIHAGIWNRVHNEMHRPTGVWWSHTTYFNLIREFHMIHHHFPRKNYGFLFAPVFDYLFGTLHVEPSREDNRRR